MARRAAAATTQLILALLRKIKKPLSAYDILSRLADDGIKSPPTVYRALEQLQEKHEVHKLAGLNAFVACDHRHGGKNCDHSHAIGFAICRSCGAVAELAHASLDTALSELSQKSGYQFGDTVIEMYGMCQGCKR
ncbi:MAG: transcriptional repressor [Alphaproteobacteria bacterium]|nr:transcriptional repressor [Alphaproteobacteria bacterium]NDC56054.1 transcriptional repressor [Alphaproteobacteria bacterium]NDG04142.1 transcriptional repressor [Alphaproteobacteria bacterium]